MRHGEDGKLSLALTFFSLQALRPPILILSSPSTTFLLLISLTSMVMRGDSTTASWRQRSSRGPGMGLSSFKSGLRHPPAFMLPLLCPLKLPVWAKQPCRKRQVTFMSTNGDAHSDAAKTKFVFPPVPTPGFALPHSHDRHQILV